MPAWSIAACERGQDGGRSKDVGCASARTRSPPRVTRRRPPNQARPAHRDNVVGRIRQRKKGAVGQIVDRQPMSAFRAAVETLGVAHAVALGRAGNDAAPVPASKGAGEGLRIRPTALEAGTMAGGERGRLIEEEQLGVAFAPDVAVAALEFKPAADPAARDPAPCAERAVVAVEAPAAVAEKKSARRIRKEIAEGIDAAGERH